MHPSKVTLRPKVRRPMAWDSTKSAPSAQQRHDRIHHPDLLRTARRNQTPSRRYSTRFVERIRHRSRRAVGQRVLMTEGGPHAAPNPGFRQRSLLGRRGSYTSSSTFSFATMTTASTRSWTAIFRSGVSTGRNSTPNLLPKNDGVADGFFAGDFAEEKRFELLDGLPHRRFSKPVP